MLINVYLKIYTFLTLGGQNVEIGWLKDLFEICVTNLGKGFFKKCIFLH